MAIFIFFFIDIEVETPAKKMTFKQEFSWVNRKIDKEKLTSWVKQKKKAKEKEEKTDKKTQVWKAPVLTFYVLMFFFGIFAGVGEFPLQELISKRVQLAHSYGLKKFLKTRLFVALGAA